MAQQLVLAEEESFVATFEQSFALPLGEQARADQVRADHAAVAVGVGAGALIELC